MTDLDKAREWAEDGKDIYDPSSRPKAAIDIILSLPDQWVDAEKLRDVVDKYEGIDAISVIIQDFADLLTPKSSINPEDVPPNEPWLIEADGRKAIGTRYKGDTRAPWAVAALDGVLTDHSNDSEITLIHKLVPETHTLPEGMRLADHKEYGRVVVSPEADHDDDYKAFHSSSEEIAGATWKYVHKNKLTFLDGEA